MFKKLTTIVLYLFLMVISFSVFILLLINSEKDWIIEDESRKMELIDAPLYVIDILSTVGTTKIFPYSLKAKFITMLMEIFVIVGLITTFLLV